MFIHVALTDLYTSGLELNLFVNPPPLHAVCLTTAATFASEIFFLIEGIGLDAILSRAKYEYSVPAMLASILLRSSVSVNRLILVRVVGEWFNHIRNHDHITLADFDLLARCEDV